jgi:hypothetical protein
VLLEAGVLGTPVAAIVCPGAVRDIVEEGVTGLTARTHGSRALARVIKMALGTSFDRERIASRVEGRFGLEVTVPAYERTLLES